MTMLNIISLIMVASLFFNFIQMSVNKSLSSRIKWYEEQRNISNDFNMKLANKIDQLKYRLQKLRNIIKTKNHVTR